MSGALARGSYVIGNPPPRSDIDIHIVRSDGTPWREPGNRIVQGYMVEYFVNPPGQIRQYFPDDRRANSWMAMVYHNALASVFRTYLRHVG